MSNIVNNPIVNREKIITSLYKAGLGEVIGKSIEN